MNGLIQMIDFLSSAIHPLRGREFLIMKCLLAFLLLLTAAPLWGQLEESDKGSVRGTLYVLVDQTATIYLNGKNVQLSKKKGDATAQVVLEPGDRLVLKISSTHDYRHLALLFVADGQNADGSRTEISFRTAYFKLIPDPDLTDFTEDQFKGYSKGATPLDRLIKRDQLAHIEKTHMFPFKNISEFFWGDRLDCTVGTIITADMFSPVTP
jgi:hypothetical protein